ncbi:MAG: cyclase family protein [Thermoanaerobaculia bacterium]
MKRMLLLTALTAVAGCARPAPEAPTDLAAPLPAALLASMEVVDLTYAFDESTIYWPTSPSAFELERLAHGYTEGGFFYAANSFCTPEHGGTHLDAPLHFAEGGWAADEIPVDRLIGPGVVIDVSAQADADADYRLTAADVEAWEAEHGTVPEGAIVLLRTGWGKHWPDAASYLGDDTPGDASDLHFPSYGKDGAELLVNERRVSVLGVDTASIDHGPSTDFIVHQIANGAGVPGLENIAHLDRLPPTGALIVALPMKIAGGSGGPLRAVALLADN